MNICRRLADEETLRHTSQGRSARMARPRVSLLTFGCRVNQYETDMMRALLANDCVLVDDRADIYVLNGCSVTGLAEKKARQAVHRIRVASPRAVVLLTGCLADAVARGMTPFEPVDAVAGNTWKTRLPEVVARVLAGERGLFPPALPRPLDEETSSGPSGRARAYLKVEDGCSGVCTYCHAVQLRGEPRSKSLRAAVTEAERLVGTGFPEIVLTGVNLAEYSTPEGGLPTLVRSLLRIQDLVRLRLASLNAAGVTDGLLDAFADDARLCPHFHIPLQAGSDRILRAMRRPTTVAAYRAAVAQIRRRLPDATFGSDLIVGFPGEDEAAFAATCRMVEEVGFSNLHAFRFSPRPGTEAATLRPVVPESVKRERADRLAAVWRPVRRRLLDARLGKVEDVLTEAEHEGRFQGHSAGYLKVTFVSDAQVPDATLCRVRITGASDDGLEGVHDDQHRAD
jgi:threonylcarbamoyladenosine tRNA methylthiotransferase MtaB